MYFMTKKDKYVCIYSLKPKLEIIKKFKFHENERKDSFEVKKSYVATSDMCNVFEREEKEFPMSYVNNNSTHSLTQETLDSATWEKIYKTYLESEYLPAKHVFSEKPEDDMYLIFTEGDKYKDSKIYGIISVSPQVYALNTLIRSKDLDEFLQNLKSPEQLEFFEIKLEKIITYEELAQFADYLMCGYTLYPKEILNTLKFL